MRVTTSTITNIHALSRAIRQDILDISFRAHTAHISSSLGIADILATLYATVLRVKPSRTHHPSRDRFILSKGHAAPALYATLYRCGFLSKSRLLSFASDGSKLAVHPEYGIPGVELSTGSLGHGLSVGVGMALAGKIDRLPYRVYVLVSDAELNEGSVWEGIQFAAHHKLDNLIVIVDDNGLQAYGRTEDILNLRPIAKKFRVFGWHVTDVDGHNHKKLLTAFARIAQTRKGPSAVIAHTTAGNGISFMADRLEWHYRNLDQSLYRKATEENSGY